MVSMISCLNCFLVQVLPNFVTDPTHISHSANNNILDLILSNNQLCLNIDEIGTPLSTSDHAIIHFSILDTSSSDANIVNDTNSIDLTCYDWPAANFSEINNAIHSIDWHSLFGYNFSADNMWTEFKNLLWPIIALFVPHKIVPHHVKYRPRCYPSNIRKLLTRKAAIWRKLKVSNSPELFVKYRTVTNECKLEILKYDTLKEQKILDAQNLGAFYKFVNRKIGNQSGVAPLKDVQLNLIASDIDKANLLNAYFELMMMVTPLIFSLHDPAPLLSHIFHNMNPTNPITNLSHSNFSHTSALQLNERPYNTAPTKPLMLTISKVTSSLPLSTQIQHPMHPTWQINSPPPSNPFSTSMPQSNPKLLSKDPTHHGLIPKFSKPSVSAVDLSDVGVAGSLPLTAWNFELSATRSDPSFPKPNPHFYPIL